MPTFDDREGLASVRAKINAAITWVDNYVPPSGLAPTFETINKNLSAEGATLAYSGENLLSLTYTNGIIKTFGYTGDLLTTVTLSGSTPSGIDLVKTFTYTGSDLTGVTYS